MVRTVHDPCCGSGGMLMITKEHVTLGLRKNGELLRPGMNPQAEIHLFGQEVNPETGPVSKSDFFMKPSYLGEAVALAPEPEQRATAAFLDEATRRSTRSLPGSATQSNISTNFAPPSSPRR